MAAKTRIRKVKKGERIHKNLKPGVVGVNAPRDGLLIGTDIAGAPDVYVPTEEIARIVSGCDNGWVDVDAWAEADEEKEDGD